MNLDRENSIALRNLRLANLTAKFFFSAPSLTSCRQFYMPTQLHNCRTLAETPAPLRQETTHKYPPKFHPQIWQSVLNSFNLDVKNLLIHHFKGSIPKASASIRNHPQISPQRRRVHQLCPPKFIQNLQQKLLTAKSKGRCDGFRPRHHNLPAHAAGA